MHVKFANVSLRLLIGVGQLGILGLSETLFIEGWSKSTSGLKIWRVVAFWELLQVKLRLIRFVWSGSVQIPLSLASSHWQFGVLHESRCTKQFGVFEELTLKKLSFTGTLSYRNTSVEIVSLSSKTAQRKSFIGYVGLFVGRDITQRQKFFNNFACPAKSKLWLKVLSAILIFLLAEGLEALPLLSKTTQVVVKMIGLWAIDQSWRAINLVWR